MAQRRSRARSASRCPRPLSRHAGLSHRGRRIGFESLEGRLLLAADFGDAPASYGTLLVDNGARHEAVGPTLGALRTAESDGTPSAKAEGDGASDDGVTFGVIRAGALNATLLVNVQNAPAGAKLDAWIDFNGDGHWTGADERIAARLAVVEGDNVVTFDVPAGAILGETFARFRVSVAGGLGPRGAAVDGEVEDYAVTIAPPLGSGYFDPTRPLGDGVSISSVDTIVAADLDGDGDLDVVSVSSGSITWQENDEQGLFTNRNLPGMYGGGTTKSLQVVDLDNDGDLDIFVKVGQSQYWARNNGDKTFTNQSLNFANAGSVAPVIIDFDGDGDLDIVSASYSTFGASGIFIQENNGPGGFTGRQLIQSSGSAFQDILSFAVLDDDGDGDLDILFGTRWDNQLFRFSNHGDGTFGASELVLPTVGGRGVASFSAIDFDQDGDVDLVASQGSYSSISGVTPTMLLWYENLGDREFVRRTISDGLGTTGTIRQIAISDVDGDGDLDVVASYIEQGYVVWHENLGGERFTPRELAQAPWRPGQPTTNRPQGVALGDVDGDGDLDVLMASTTENRLRWLAHLSPPAEDYGDAPAPYPTGFAANGARHVPVGPMLGTTRDADAGPLPSVDADGDGADDDGVIVTPIRVGQLAATWSVTIANAPAGARLDAWIDFDGDGNWSRADERIAANWAVVEGESLLTFNVPTWATAGVTYARFRVSTAGGLGFAGAATDGEVEDYAVAIEPPVAATGAYFQFHPMRAAPADSLARAVVVDLDRDGDNDLVAVRPDGKSLAWYENDGSGGYIERVIPGQATRQSLVVADVDGDGDLDVFQAYYGVLNFVYVNDGLQNFLERQIVNNWGSSTNLSYAFADVEGDGDVDLLTPRGWVESLGDWPVYARDLPFAETAANYADLDRDGHLDMIAGIASNGIVTWRAFQLGDFVGPLLAKVEPALDTYYAHAAADVNGDGYADLVAVGATPRSVTILLNGGKSAFVTINAGEIDGGGVRSVLPADLDGDGDVDIVVATTVATTWFENLGDFHFAQHQIAGGGVASLGDMDGDGRLDVVVGSTSPADAYGGGWGWYSIVERRVSLAADRPILDEEASEEVVFTFTREGDTSESATISFSVTGNATFGVDYLVAGAAEFDGQTGSVLFPANVTSVEVRVTAINDAIKELDETVSLSLPALDGYAIGAGAATATILSAELGGDFNDDGVVDGADFLLWQRTLGQAAEPAGAGADGDFDGAVDADDLAMWKANFGRQAPPEAGMEAAPTFAVEAAVFAEAFEETAPFASSMANLLVQEQAPGPAAVSRLVSETPSGRQFAQLAGVAQRGASDDRGRDARHQEVRVAAADAVFAREGAVSTDAPHQKLPLKWGVGWSSDELANRPTHAKRLLRAPRTLAALSEADAPQRLE